MDAKQFDELVAKLTRAPSRRDALKGALGGALAAVGLSADALSKGKGGNGKKGRGRPGGENKGKGNKGRGKGGAGAAKKGKGKGKNKGKVTICHYPPGNPSGCQTIRVGEKAAKRHIRNHGDTRGACPYGC